MRPPASLARVSARRRAITCASTYRPRLNPYPVIVPSTTNPSLRYTRLLAAGAGASGRDDISERIEEILANEVQPSH